MFTLKTLSLVLLLTMDNGSDTSIHTCNAFDLYVPSIQYFAPPQINIPAMPNYNSRSTSPIFQAHTSKHYRSVPLFFDEAHNSDALKSKPKSYFCGSFNQNNEQAKYVYFFHCKENDIKYEKEAPGMIAQEKLDDARRENTANLIIARARTNKSNYSDKA